MTEAHPVVERYLAKLADELATLPQADRAEIVQEIRHHVDDAVAAGRPLDAVLESLGSAETLARAYAVESLLHPRPNERPNRLGRFFKIAGLVAVTSIPTIVIVAVLGAIGVSFVASGVAIFVAGVLEVAGIYLPGVEMTVAPIWAILAGPPMAVIGVAALVGLVAYVRFLARAFRAVLPGRRPLSPRGARA